MPNMYRVEPVLNEDGHTHNYEVQIKNNNVWKTMYQNGSPLSFKLERMANMRAACLESKALHKFPIVNCASFV